MPKGSKQKSGSGKSAKRREDLRRNLPKPTANFRTLLQRPEFATACMLLLGFALVTSVIVVWSREQITVTPGQIMSKTRLNRLAFTVVDEPRTDEARRDARERAPDVYTINAPYLKDLRSPLRSLPVVVAQETDLDNIGAEIREAYALDATALAALPQYAADGNPTPEWTKWVDRLLTEELPRHPLLNSAEWQSGLLEPEHPLLRAADGREVAEWSDAIQIRGRDEASLANLRQSLEPIVRGAGFPRAVAEYVSAGLTSRVQPTYVLNQRETAILADERAGTVTTFRMEHPEGQAIYQRGDRLTDQQLADLKTETAYFNSTAPAAERWLPRVGIAGLISFLLLFAGGFVSLTYPRVVRNAVRLVAICLLMTATLGVTVIVSSQVPQLLFPAAVALVLFVSIILLLSYDQRLALFLGTIQCAIVTLALSLGIGDFILLMTGCGIMIGQLREVRHRNTLIRASIVTAIALGAGTIFMGLFVYPAVDGVLIQILGHAASAIAASIVIGFLVLGILPSIERLFDITTGMTLAELRDPSQPLLRQLQQRAPGTYNHSLQVANIAEAAADAIGADGLLIYVGALYHDIGKMNKPEYFVENQSGGFNKHSKLRPAMSLLVIIGHVKDGIELAREYGLPRALQHFIESHHGTTLVEYFYHAAKAEAETDVKASVAEVEFRYPGPRPRSKEAAILMLSDAVESATRAMTEPNPGRIESLVRKLSRKRLLDGQFDECDLTFRELGLIEDAMIARLCAIHHGRISYPSAKTDDEPAAAVRAKPA